MSSAEALREQLPYGSVLEEMRVLDQIVFGVAPRPTEKQFDQIRADLTPLHRSILKRFFCRQESINEIGKHKGLRPDVVAHQIDLAVSKLHRRLIDLTGHDPEPPVRLRTKLRRCRFCRQEHIKVGTHICWQKNLAAEASNLKIQKLRRAK